MEDVIKDIADSLGTWAYLLVALMAMAETAAFLGFIAPGEFTIILGGVLAGEGTLSIGLLIGIVWISILIGDSIGFLLGRKLGRGFARKHGPRVRLTEERIDRVESYFKRHGGKTVFFGRWIGFVRPLMPFTAGASGMPYRRFVPYDVLSAGLFGTTFTLLGFIFWHSLDTITKVAGRGAFGIGVIVALFFGGKFAYKRLRDPQKRAEIARWLDEQGERPLLKPLFRAARLLWRVIGRPAWRFVVRPIVRVLKPPLRFVADRLTPGGLGIEFTTLVASASVGGYVFGLYTSVVDDGSTTPADRWALDRAVDIKEGAVTTIAKIVTALGSNPEVIAVALVAIAALLYRRRLAESVVLATGLIAVHLAIQIARDAVERPRPGGALIDVDGYGFPSGHAALSITYVAVAVALSRIVRRASLRVGLVTAGIAIAALVGLTRVYLRAHYLSDVVAGWALAVAIFSLLGTIALVVSFVRNNVRADRRPKPREQLTTASDG